MAGKLREITPRILDPTSLSWKVSQQALSHWPERVSRLAFYAARSPLRAANAKGVGVSANLCTHASGDMSRPHRYSYKVTVYCDREIEESDYAAQTRNRPILPKQEHKTPLLELRLAPFAKKGNPTGGHFGHHLAGGDFVYVGAAALDEY